MAKVKVPSVISIMPMVAKARNIAAHATVRRKAARNMFLSLVSASLVIDIELIFSFPGLV